MQTANYTIFDLHALNRDLRPGKLAKLKASMAARGFIPGLPIYCERRGKKLVVKSGHHRLHVAMELGLPVYYIVSNDGAPIQELEDCASTWNLTDHIKAYAKQGVEPYCEVVDYCDRTGVGFKLAASMFWGELSSTGNSAEVIKKGTFYIRDRRQPLLVERLINVMAEVRIDFACHAAMVHALSRLVLTPEFDAERLIQKIRRKSELLKKRSSFREYLVDLEQVYNFGAAGHKKTPIAHLADQAAASRNTIFQNGQKDRVKVRRKEAPNGTGHAAAHPIQ